MRHSAEMPFFPLALAGLAVFAACNGDGDSLASPIGPSGCQGVAGPPDNCPAAGCPQTFTTVPAEVCPSDANIKQPITFYPDCDGLDVIFYNGVDTAQVIYFRASDGGLLGYQRLSANFGGSATCVTGVPTDFSIEACSTHTTIVCGQ